MGHVWEGLHLKLIAEAAPNIHVQRKKKSVYLSAIFSQKKHQKVHNHFTRLSSLSGQSDQLTDQCKNRPARQQHLLGSTTPRQAQDVVWRRRRPRYCCQAVPPGTLPGHCPGGARPDRQLLAAACGQCPDARAARGRGAACGPRPRPEGQRAGRRETTGRGSGCGRGRSPPTPGSARATIESGSPAGQRRPARGRPASGAAPGLIPST